MLNFSEVAKALLDIKAVKLSPNQPFTWTSGIKSPIYCDNRLTLSYPKVRSLLVSGLMEIVKSGDFFNEQPESIAGVATAGIPHGALLADRLDLPFVYVRSKPKAHGRQNQIEGFLQQGAKVLVIEDLISTGGSSLQAVEVLRSVGAEIIGVLALFDYGFEDTKLAFQAANCPYTTLTNYQDLLTIAKQHDYITPIEAEALRSWSQNPKGWGAQFE